MQLTIREPGSAITHFIGCLMALIAASPLLIKAHGNATYMLAMTIFATSMVLLFVISQAKRTSLAMVPSRGIFAILADKRLQFTSQGRPSKNIWVYLAVATS